MGGVGATNHRQLARVSSVYTGIYLEICLGCPDKFLGIYLDSSSSTILSPKIGIYLKDCRDKLVRGKNQEAGASSKKY